MGSATSESMAGTVRRDHALALNSAMASARLPAVPPVFFPRLFSSLLAALVSFGVSAGPVFAEDAVSPSVSRTVGLSMRAREAVEEVTVTVRRRQELLEEAPLSVTAIDERELREAGVTSVEQIQRLVPNLVFTRSFTGTVAEIKIRGVGTSAIDGIFDPGVGVYLDGVFLSRTGSQVFDIVDIDQVEVLRGPQGTLFGKNTIGGALNVTTIKPHREPEGFGWVRVGNYGAVETRAMLNLPIVEDRVLARLAVGSRNTTGYTTNVLRDERYNDPSVLTFLGSVRVFPVDDVTIDVSGSWAKQHGRGQAGQCAVVAEQGLGRLVPGYFDACRQSEPYDFEADTHGIQGLETAGAWGVASWDLGDVGEVEDLTLKAIGGWRHQETTNRIDLDNTRYPLGSLAANGGGPFEGEPFRLNMYQAELQASGRVLDRVTFLGGAFGYWEDQRATTVLRILPDLLSTITSQTQDYDNSNWALFGQATGEITDWLSLTAGLRYTQERKDASTTAIQLGDPAMPTTSAANAATFAAWTPMASLAATLPEDVFDDVAELDYLMGYFTYARGFKGGGFNLATGTVSDRLGEFRPETLDSFEIGAKAFGFDRRLSLNVALFLGSYDDIQVTTLRVIDADSDIPEFERQTLNAAEATTKGFEVELLALPTAGLEVRGTVGYTRGVYDQFSGASAIDDTVVDRAGETFNGVPELQTHLSAQYSFQVSEIGARWLDGWVTPRVEWYYQSAVHWDFPELRAARQSGYSLLHARLSYDFNDDRSQVALWGKNLTNQEYFDATFSVANVAGTLSRYFAPPVTFGVELSHRFR